MITGVALSGQEQRNMHLLATGVLIEIRPYPLIIILLVLIVLLGHSWAMSLLTGVSLIKSTLCLYIL